MLGPSAYNCSAYRQSRRRAEPAQRNVVKCVPFGAEKATIATEPRGTVPPLVTLAVTSPRMPGPSGVQARRIVIPLVAKSLNAVVLKLVRSAWQLATVN
jgi:hypothetical protein